MAPKIIMFHSYKGGSGKTILSVNMATQLARDYRILLIEGDLDGPVLARNLPDLSDDPYGYFNEYLRNPDNIGDYITPYDPFDLILASSDFNKVGMLKGDDYSKLLPNIPDIRKQLMNLDYDYIIFDLSPGVNYLAIFCFFLTQEIFLVLRPDRNSYNGTQILIDEIYKNVVRKHKRTFHLIINQLPDLDEFDEVVMEWGVLFKYQYDFIENYHKLPFYARTSYNSLNSGMILPDDDPLIESIREIGKTLE